jgi:DNA-directed RNA polymerase specialized sigma24 family protein
MSETSKIRGKSEILTEIYLSAEVEKMIRSLKPCHLQDDIKQHCFIELLEKDEEFIMDLHNRGKLKNYIVKVLYNTARFTRTSFTKQLGKETPTETFEDVPEEEYEEVSVNIENLHWYKREVLKLYAEQGTYQKVSDLTHIPMTSIYQTVLEARKQVLKEYYESQRH